MSITFHIPCDCPHVEALCEHCGQSVYTSPFCCITTYNEDMDAFWRAVEKARCPHDALAVQQSNANARDLIEALGVEFDYCGSINVEDLLGRAGLRAALPADEPLPQHEEKASGGAHMVYCGRPEGYIAEKAASLVTLALRAREDGYDCIQWG